MRFTDVLLWKNISFPFKVNRIPYRYTRVLYTFTLMKIWIVSILGLLQIKFLWSFVWTYTLISLRWTPTSEMARSYGRYFKKILLHYQVVFQSDCIIKIPINSVWELQLLHVIINTWCNRFPSSSLGTPIKYVLDDLKLSHSLLMLYSLFLIFFNLYEFDLGIFISLYLYLTFEIYIIINCLSVLAC